MSPELFGYKQWVLWRRVDVNGRSAKVPISHWRGKAAACDKPQTWSTYLVLATQCGATELMVWVSFSRILIPFVGSTLINAEMRVE
jgi:hypothetical protein